MTLRGPGRVSRTPEMEEKEQLRRQIRLLQGLIDDYKTLHGNASAPGTSAAPQWPPPTYSSSRAFSARYPRVSRRGFSPDRGPAWRKKYSLVNRPLGSLDPPGDCAAQPPLGAGGSQGPDPQQYILERQVQLSPDQNMVIKIKPPSKPGSASAAGLLRGSLEEYEDPPWSDHRPQEGEGEPPGGQRQPSRPGRAKGSCSAEDPLLLCQKEPCKPRVVKSTSSVSDSPSEPRRTVSESAVAVKARFLPSSLPQRGGTAAGQKVGSQSVASGVTQLLADGRANAGHADQAAASGLVAGPARPAAGPRQTREPSLLVSCRINKFRKNNYKWVAASAKSPRAPRRALGPRVAAESVCKAPFASAERTEKLQLGAGPDAKPRRSASSSVPGASPSKYKWKASSPSASSSSSFRWQSEAGSKDHTSQLSPVPSRSPPGDRPAVEPSNLKPLFSETPLSAYKVKSRTKIIRRRGGASIPGDKKSSPPPAATAKSQFSLRRRQALRGKSSPVLKKMPNKGLMQVTRHRLCCLPPSRAHLATKEASSLHGQRTPPASKVIKTRYRIVKKTPASPLSTAPGPPAPPSWRARRLSLSRSLVLNSLRSAPAGGKAQTGSPRWRNKGYRCIGGVLYKVSANKLSKTCGRPSTDGGGRPPLRAVQEEAHTAVSGLLPQGHLLPGRPVPAAAPQPEAPRPAGSHTTGSGAQPHAPQEQGFHQPRAQDVLGRPEPHQTDVQLPSLRDCWLGLPTPIPTGVSRGLCLLLLLRLLPLSLLSLLPLPLVPLPLLPLRLPVPGPGGAVAAGRGRLGGHGLWQPLQAAVLHLPAVLAEPRRPAQGPDPQECPHQGLRPYRPPGSRDGGRRRRAEASGAGRPGPWLAGLTSRHQLG
ncbi:zinc finger CCCH domain-containing protein 3 isoform X5 [Hippopotamus amphibius kiboko]|uniref:zinc finger CCCH domain-containing protein 3 isoform X5 n=1 Tax=Hippopotamus amphibius kiboko TaxID=575201 RepID=UPI0025930FA2|nr:zinc finger CCCH domain-containing protein 3 isoform X5 [Hippopotamus amphibius kiboko]